MTSLGRRVQGPNNPAQIRGDVLGRARQYRAAQAPDVTAMMIERAHDAVSGDDLGKPEQSRWRTAAAALPCVDEEAHAKEGDTEDLACQCPRSLTGSGRPIGSDPRGGLLMTQDRPEVPQPLPSHGRPSDEF